jgi:hypothetical protein
MNDAGFMEVGDARLQFPPDALDPAPADALPSGRFLDDGKELAAPDERQDAQPEVTSERPSERTHLQDRDLPRKAGKRPVVLAAGLLRHHLDGDDAATLDRLVLAVRELARAPDRAERTPANDSALEPPAPTLALAPAVKLAAIRVELELLLLLEHLARPRLRYRRGAADRMGELRVGETGVLSRRAARGRQTGDPPRPGRHRA